MAGTSEALTELRRGLKVFKAFEGAEKAIAALEGLEQNERELTARVAALKAECESIERRRGEVVAAFEADAAAAEKQARDAESKARYAGTSIVAEAEEKARGIVGDAAAKVASAERAVKESRKQAQELAGEVERAKAELSDLNARIHAAKAKIADMLKG